MSVILDIVRAERNGIGFTSAIIKEENGGQTTVKIEFDHSIQHPTYIYRYVNIPFT